MRHAQHILLTLCVFGASFGASAAEPVKSPEEVFGPYPTFIKELPPGWSTTKPIRLQVCFNLKYAVNSPEANAFLKDWYQRIRKMPHTAKLRMERVVYPAKFHYCALLTFRNWAHNRAYEKSGEFMKYYKEVWKPAVTEQEEMMTILDTDVTPRP